MDYQKSKKQIAQPRPLRPFPPMDLKKLDYFVHVADLGSFTELDAALHCPIRTKPSGTSP